VLVQLTLPGDHPSLHIPSILPSSNAIAVFLQVTTGEMLPTFYKGSSTLFPTEKAGDSIFLTTSQFTIGTPVVSFF